MNLSLLAKLGWKIITKPSLLWVAALSGKYLRSGISFLNASFSHSAYWLWKGILKARQVVELVACMAVSSGQGINIWKSPWIPSIQLFKPSPNPNLVDLPNFEVADLLNEGNRSWNVSLLTDLFDSNSAQHIQNIHLSQEVSSDRWTWVGSLKGQFFVRSAHELASQDLASCSSPLSPEDWSCLWGLKLCVMLEYVS
jgi:hypothetical protein